MRRLFLLALTLLPALAQGTPVHLRVLPGSLGLRKDRATVRTLGEAEVRPSVASVLALEGFRLVTATEAQAAPEGLILTVRALEYQLTSGSRGYDLSLRLSRADLDRDLLQDPKALVLMGSKVGQSAKISEGVAQTELASLLTRLLKTHLGSVPPSAPRPKAPLPTGVPLASAGGVVGGTGRVVNFDFSELQVKARPPAPPYPEVARAARIQGLVVLEVLIDPEGVPVEVTCKEGPDILRTCAAAYALDWRFEPMKINGAGQWAKFLLRMPFKLTD